MMLPVGADFPVCGRQPLRTYYQVLEVSPAEQDPSVIEAAAVRCSGHVRIYQLTRESECTLRLNEIAEAMITLLDPVRRRQYDLGLCNCPTPALSDPWPSGVREPPRSLGRKRLSGPGEGPLVILNGDGGSCDVTLVYRRRAAAPSLAL
jgi:hypothetical protein